MAIMITSKLFYPFCSISRRWLPTSDDNFMLMYSKFIKIGYFILEADSHTMHASKILLQIVYSLLPYSYITSIFHLYFSDKNSMWMW